MGSLPNLHELGREDGGAHFRPGPALGHLCGGHAQSTLSHEERSRVLHRHSGHCRVKKAKSIGHGSRIIYDDFMLEQMAAYSPVSSRSTRNLPSIKRRDSLNSSIGATSVRRLIAVVRNTSSRSGPVYSRRVLIRNLLILCLTHILICSTFLPFLALQSSVSVWTLPLKNEIVPITINIGSLLLALFYLLAAFSSLLSPSLIQKLGTNTVLSISYGAFAVFYAAHLFPALYFLLPVYFVLGVVLGPLSLARVSFLMTLSTKLSYAFLEEDEEAKNLRRTCIIRRVARAFKASHDLGFILGSIFTSILTTYTVNLEGNTTVAFSTNTTATNSNFSSTTTTSYKNWSSLSSAYDYSAFLDDIFDVDESGDRLCGAQACPTSFVLAFNSSEEASYYRVLPRTTTAVLAGVYVSVCGFALAVVVVWLDRIRMYVHQDPLERPEGLAALKTVRDSFRDVRLRLAAPLAVFIGLEQAFMYADFSKSYVICTLGIHRLNLVFLCMGLLQSIAACTLSMLLRSIRRYYVIAVGFTFHACLLMVQTVWKPIGDDPALFYVISAAWGVCNAIWEMLNFTLLTGLYADSWEAPFANSFFFRFLGFSVAFAFHGLVCNFVKLYFLAVFMVFAAALLTYLEVRLENVKKEKNISRL